MVFFEPLLLPPHPFLGQETSIACLVANWIGLMYDKKVSLFL